MVESEKSTIAYRIEIDKSVWKKFKAKTDKSMTMNTRICKLIYDVVGEKYPVEQQVGKPSTKKKSTEKK